MASRAELAEARQLIELDVKEVSLVDRAANLRRFLVVKREDAMSMFDSDLDDIEITKQDEDDEEEEKKKEQAKKVALTPPMMALAKTMLGLMKKAMSDAGVDSSEMGKALAAMDKLMDDKYPSPTSKARDEEEEEEEKGAKTKAGHTDDEEEDEKKPFGRKSKASKAEEPVFKMMPNGDIILSGDIAKGRRMTTARTEKLTQAFGQMAALLKELDETEFEKAVAALAKGDLPRDPGFESQVRPTKPDVAKGLTTDDLAQAVAKAIAKEIAPLAKEVQQIKKARAGTASLEGDGGTDDDKTKLEKGGVSWRNVL